MNWGLPASVEIGGVSYEIRTDFRVILDIFVMLSDPDLSGTDRAEGILQMFYVSPEDIPPQHLQEAVDRFTWFQNGGKEQDKKKSPKLVDWEQDYPLILPPINRVFGQDIRGIPYDAETNTGGVHWWTFLGAYNDLGDCTFAQVVRIRDKKARGKTLEKDEREWYRRNRMRRTAPLLVSRKPRIRAFRSTRQSIADELGLACLRRDRRSEL